MKAAFGVVVILLLAAILTALVLGRRSEVCGVTRLSIFAADTAWPILSRSSFTIPPSIAFGNSRDRYRIS